MLMKPVKIGDKTARFPIIQGGMGVGVSRSSLAGAVASEGGIGVISSAQIGYDEEGFDRDQQGCNLRAIEKHIKKAKEIAGNGGGLVGINIMVALKHFADHVKAAVKAGADVIISGAGLPVKLPELVEGSDTKIAPIVSSRKSAEVILKMWDRKYHRTADFLVIEGPKAGGHLGFSYEQLEDIASLNYDQEIRDIIEYKKEYEEKYQTNIPVFVAGGIFTKEDVEHALSLGADGVQVATRFVPTKECDASQEYKQAYLDAKEEDIRIIKSPVGMPGRAVNNAFLEKVDRGEMKIEKCYNCLAKCNPKEIPYCITKALVDAVDGRIDDGLIFCGSNAARLHEMTTVHDVMEDLKV
ncbi:MAG: NAD(P)H-dependent flavin oxidoreductase [Lachnospiraceae bacterium]